MIVMIIFNFSNITIPQNNPNNQPLKKKLLFDCIADYKQIVFD